ncbi:IclR family transcriptional regulator [Paenibacillus sp. GCM10027626]|uniref:IclR family transcriptional regulator n=1 Tax=Paenibacillus sp. GCM10027626 TaxID=3273411 RepID=UPI0036280FDE
MKKEGSKMEKQSPKVKSADRVLDIFELFTGEKESYNLTEISKELNMPSSSAYQILQNMLSRGYLETDSSGKQFRLGNKIFEIRVQHRQSTSMTAEFYQIAGKIVEDLKENVMLGVRSEDKVVYIAEKLVDQPLRIMTNLGSVLPLHASASGKMLLSRMPEEKIDQLYRGKKLPIYTGKTIATLEELKKELEVVRERGLAYNIGESVEGIHCMAGPVCDMEGNVVAAVSVSIPAIRITEETWQKTASWIERACREISNKMYRQN